MKRIVRDIRNSQEKSECQKIKSEQELLQEDSSLREYEEYRETGDKELCDDDILHGDATLFRQTCSVCVDFRRDGELWCKWVRL